VVRRVVTGDSNLESKPGIPSSGNQKRFWRVAIQLARSPLPRRSRAWMRSWVPRLRLKSTDIDATTKYANERRASLIVKRRRSEVGIASINCRAAQR
jgi:hypothetical protein